MKFKTHHLTNSKKYFVYPLLYVLLLFSFGCTRKEDTQSKIKFSLPVGHLQKSEKTSSMLLSQSSSTTASSWGLADPTNLDEVSCYIVGIEGPEPYLHENYCSDSSGNIVFQPGMMIGGYLAGSTLEVVVPAGPERKIYLIGFSASDEISCYSSLFAKSDSISKLSAPQILGMTTINLEPGIVETEITVSLVDAKKYESCSGPMFDTIINPGDGTIAPPPTTTPINPVANVIISDGFSIDFGSTSLSTTLTHIVTLQNTGTVDATGLAASNPTGYFSFSGGNYPGAGGTCGAILSAGSSCFIYLNFLPTVAGTYTGTMNLNFHDGVGPVVYNLQLQGVGTGFGPASLTISEGDPFDFLTLPVGSSSSKIFTITNVGGTTATAMTGYGLTTPYSFTSGSYPGISGTCSTVLSSSSSCTIEVSFSPYAAGSAASSFTIDYHDGTSSQSLVKNLTGNGTSNAFLVLSDGPTFEFGTTLVGSSVTHMFTISNTGSSVATSIANASLATPYGYTGAIFPGTGGNCATSLSPSSSCTIEVEFNPYSVGSFPSSLNISYFDGVAAQNTSINLNGSGMNPLTLAGASYGSSGDGSRSAGGTYTTGPANWNVNRYQRVAGASSLTGTTSFTVATSASFAVGDEIMIHTTASFPNNSCGPLVGEYRIRTISAIPDSTTIQVSEQSDPFFSGIVNTYMANPPEVDYNNSSGYFCFMQLARIAQLQDVTIPDGGQLFADALDMAAQGGGILAMRISGTLYMGNNSLIHANHLGFYGNSTRSGGGVAGLFHASLTPPSYNNGGNVGSNVSYGGGGGAHGDGACVANCGQSGFGVFPGTPVGTFDLQPSIFMGGSGGRGAAGTGGRGGGIIYIHAKHIQAGTNAKIESRGQFAGGTNGNGGGAGGAILLFTETIDGNLQFDVAGGDGEAGNSSTWDPGGGGAGGRIHVRSCNGNPGYTGTFLNLIFGGLGAGGFQSGHQNSFQGQDGSFFEEQPGC